MRWVPSLPVLRMRSGDEQQRRATKYSAVSARVPRRAEAAAAVAARGQFVMAVSGGRTPWIMLRALGNEEVPWERVHVVQVDERVARQNTRTGISSIFEKL
jgi:6-phosphogluconolactonase/glucosamine-6-phosphate isomerase/deaminase